MSSAASPRDPKASLIGSDFNSVPYLSPFGRLYRLSRLNGLWLHQFPYMFGIPPFLQSQLREGGVVPWKGLHAWDAASSTEGVRVQCDWRDWYPYRNGTVDEFHTRLRGCPLCFSYGYHTMLHQLPWISSCPWHRVALVDACICGRSLMSKVRDSRTAKLLACICGNDHFDRQSALLGMDQWPTAEVHCCLATYLNFSGNERRRTTLITSHTVTQSRAYSMIEPVFESPYHSSLDANHRVKQIVNATFRRRIYDESTSDTATNDLIVWIILRKWWQLTGTSTWDYLRIPITTSCYGQILQHSGAINLEAFHRFGIRDLVDVSANDIYAQRRLIAEGDSENFCFPRVDGGIIGERLGLLAVQLFDHVCPCFRHVGGNYHAPLDSYSAEQALLEWSKTSQARTLALALSEITTLITIDYLREILHAAPSISHAVHYRLELGTPVILVRDPPDLKIVVGFIPSSLGTLRNPNSHSSARNGSREATAVKKEVYCHPNPLL